MHYSFPSLYKNEESLSKCLSVCSPHSTKTMQHIHFRLGSSIADDLRMCLLCIWFGNV